MLTDRVGQFSTIVVLVASDCKQFTLSLLVLLAQLLDDLSLFFDLLLQRVVLMFLLQHFFFHSLALCLQLLLGFTFLFQLELELSMLLSLDLLGFLKCFTAFHQLVLHTRHELLQLRHLLFLPLQVLLLLFLFVFLDELHILALRLQLFKKLLDGFFP